MDEALLEGHFTATAQALAKTGEVVEPTLKHGPMVPRIELVIDNLSLDVDAPSKLPCARKTSIRLLNGIDAVIEPGQLVALMGSSGAGKSTLLNALAGRTDGRVGGCVLVNGLNRTSHFENVVSYVMQDDLLFPLLTVREAVFFSANYRLPRAMSAEEKDAAVALVMDRLNISACGQVRIGGGGFRKGISGGERKRTSVACEIVTNPSVLFLDEPTSGLDSNSAEALVASLRELAREGRTIIATIHQPSSAVFHMFDKLLLLAKPGDGTGGNLAYFGPTSQVADFFAQCGFPLPPNVNVADHVIKCITAHNETQADGTTRTLNQDAIESIVEYFNSSLRPLVRARVLQRATESFEELGTTMVRDPALGPKRASLPALDQRPELHFGGRDPARGDFDLPTQPRIGLGRELALMMREHSLLILRNPRTSIIRLAQVLFLSVLGGLVYLQMGFTQAGLQNRMGALFFFTTNTFLAAMMASLNIFPADRPIFLREHASHSYGRVAYWLAKSTLVSPIDIVVAVIYSVIVYFMAGLQPVGSKFGIFLGTICMNVLAATSVGLFVSTGVKDMATALLIGSAWLIPLLLFGGFFIAAGSIPVFLAWIAYLSPFYYTFPILFSNELTGLTFSCLPEELITLPPSLGCNVTQICPFTSGETFLAYQGYASVDILFNLAMQAVLIVGYRLLSLVLFILATQSKVVT